MFEAFDRVNKLIVDDVDADIIQYIIIRHGILGLDATHVAPLLPVIKSLYEEYVGGQEPHEMQAPYGPIVADMIQDGLNLSRLGGLVKVTDLKIPLPQAGAVMCFLNAYPQFWPKLQSLVPAIKFNSGAADSMGGGLFTPHDCVIHMSALAVPPGVFVRLLVHEIGHATFERILLDHKPMPEKLNLNKVPEMLAPFAHQGPSIPSDTLQEYGRQCEEIHNYWTGMSVLAQTFYQAWLTLSKHHGQHLLGLDLWRVPPVWRMTPERRRRYQADNFGEFCAETFMLFAMGDLASFVAAIMADGSIGPDVRIAWRNAWHVLEAVASPILGPRTG
jgi:hypothetical protein